MYFGTTAKRLARQGMHAGKRILLGKDSLALILSEYSSKPK